MIYKDEPCRKIRDIYPDIGECGIDVDGAFNETDQRWWGRFEKDLNFGASGFQVGLYNMLWLNYIKSVAIHPESQLRGIFYGTPGADSPEYCIKIGPTGYFYG